LKSRATAPARNKRINGFLHCFGNSRIAVAPQERIADADANSAQVACACLRDQRGRVDTGGVERGKAVGEVADAARQQPRRVERKRQGHDAIGGPAPDGDLQAGIAGHASWDAHRARRIAAERE
jgi:hypothetical protein